MNESESDRKGVPTAVLSIYFHFGIADDGVFGYLKSARVKHHNFLITNH